MSQRKQRRIIKKSMVERYNQILIAAKDIVNTWKVERIPLKIVNDIIDQFKINIADKNNDLLVIEGEFNNTLELLKKLLKRQSDIIGDNYIHITYIESFIKSLKGGTKK